MSIDVQKKLTLGLAIIVKDDSEVELLKRALDSVKKVVDTIYITGTKEPQEKIKALCEEYKAIYSFYPWDNNFSNARNFSFDQVKEDYILWMDADDVYHNVDAIPSIVIDAKNNNQAAIFFDYWYMVDIDEKGNVREIIIEHKRERIIRNDKTFKWIGKLHETLIEQRSENIIKVYRPECKVIHLTTNERADENINRNIKILEDSAREENHKDPRTLMYLAKSYYDKGKMEADAQKKSNYYDLAIALFQEYLSGAGIVGSKDYQEPSGWAEERSTAWEYMAQIFREKGMLNAATKAIVNATIEDPRFPNYYLEFALICTMKGEWDKAEHWLRVGVNTPFPNTTIIAMPRELKSRALEIDYNIAMARQDLPRAKNAAEKFLEMFPNLEEAKKRVDMVNELITVNKVAQSIVYVGKYLELHNEKEKLISLTNSVPQQIEGEHFASQMRHRFLPARVWEKNEVAILCGPGFEKWSPKNIKQGIGGSEEAVIYLSKELVKKGYKVTIYGDPQDDAGEYEGVTYKSWHSINAKDTFNILILWRAIGFVDNNFFSNQTYLWLHDVPNVSELTEERIKKIDKVFVLSKFHKSLLRMNKGGEFVEMPEEKIFLTSNGLPLPIDINTKWGRDPHKLIYGSSYDRGLVYLLKMWPDIKKEIPDATLDIYYGWNLYDRIHAGNPASAKWKSQMQALMAQEGIVDHGRVSHAELNKAYATSAIWSYSCAFEEISCMSAMKAQAYGAIPMVTDYAALKETVKWGEKAIVDITDPDGQKQYKDMLIELLKDTKKQEEIRKEMMEKSPDLFSWTSVAEKWDELFKSKKDLVKIL